MRIGEIKKLGLWPESKKTTNEKGVPELEELGYNLFYIGKNADLYTCPGDEAKVLLVRTDRCSVFDIPLDLEIEGKGIAQAQISEIGAEFAENLAIPTAFIFDEFIDVPESIAFRCQVMDLLKPLEAEIDNEVVQFEFIFRNYLTGSLYKLNKDGEDPYGLTLDSNLEEWYKFDTPLFTPTTKGVKDIPLNSQIVRQEFSDIIDDLEFLFEEFTKYAYEKGIIVVDTKFEVFVDSEGKWCLGDEVLTPESSRFMPRKDFESGNRISMDKQVLRNFAEESGWKEQAKNLKPGEKLKVDVPNSVKKDVMEAYNIILEVLGGDGEIHNI